MRGPLVALSLLALPAALVAQRHGGVIVEKPAAPPARQPAREPHRGYGRDVYPAPIWVVAPRISMDSAVRLVERTYPGWFVDSKSLSHEYLRPIYLFTMIGAGQTGTRQLWVDGNSGVALNPQVLGVSDSTDYYERWRPPYPLAPSYP